jgi:hypothetical protein
MRAIPLLLIAAAAQLAAADWKPVPGRISTRWAKDVAPDNVWREYPRPQLIRERWQNLNGLWDYAITGEAREWKGGRVENARFDPLNKEGLQPPPQWDGKILVPFCPESSLSGVGKIVRPDQLLWYRRAVQIPPAWRGQRVLLHLEAVDWHSVVFVNGKRVGENRGGYTRFSLDITSALKPGPGQEILLVAWDPTNVGDQTIGKQSLPEMRQGFRYTPTTGIWQTAWMEPVAGASIETLKIEPDIDGGAVRVSARIAGPAAANLIEVDVFDGARKVASGTGAAAQPLAVRIPAPKLWSPNQPFLYDLKLTLRANGQPVDTVRSYFGMRKIAVAKDKAGIARFFLNNEVLPFQFGPLDQGYWPDGILTPASDKAAAFDVEYLKQIACNMIRVHIKVHPARWYYHCDRLGVLVWQDMVCSRRFESKITAESARQWELEQRRMIDHLYNHPSVIQWVVFNEAWGQYDTERLTEWTKRYDPSRVVSAASGWNDAAGAGEVRDIHDYSIVPSIPLAREEGKRAIVIGEFGGFNVHLKGHLWHPDQDQPQVRDWAREGSRERYQDAATWLTSYRRWIQGWKYLIAEHGLNAGVYTQIADVEHETNGWLTYDREVSKIGVETLRALHGELYQSPPRGKALLSDESRAWRHSTAAPAQGWEQPEFDDSRWESGAAPAEGQMVWLRRRFRLDTVPKAFAVRASGRGDAEVWINGKLARALNHRGSRSGDIQTTIQPVWPESGASLRAGDNVIAVRAFANSGPAAAEFGLLELEGER